MSLLQIADVRKSFGTFQALKGVSFDVKEGAIYGLLGPNGAGKTTLIRCINQITHPDSGQILLSGAPLKREDVRRIGYLPEERGLYKKMKVGDQALYLAQLKGMSKRDAMRALKYWFDKFGIADWWSKKVEELSKGMAQKVQFIVTVLHEPRLLIFDEPFSGFDPINAELLKNEILGLRDKGATVLFSTHNMDSVERICDSITLFNKGHNVLTGDVASIRERFSASRFKLGYQGDAAALQQALGAEWRLEPLPATETTQWVNLESDRRDVKTNELLQHLLQYVEVANFSREIATMNDIFIRVVRETSEHDAETESPSKEEA